MNPSVVLFLLVLAPALALVLALLGLETFEENILGWLDLAIGVGYPSGAIIHFWNRRKPFRQEPDKIVEDCDVISFWMNLPGLLAIFLAPPLEYLYLPAFLPRTGWMQSAGLILIFVGVTWNLWAWAILKRQNQGCDQVTGRNHLIQNGPYRHLRHPSYTGYFLMILGFCLGYSSFIGLSAIPLLLPGVVYRINQKEKLLAVSFGEEYRTYAHKTKRFLPGIW